MSFACINTRIDSKCAIRCMQVSNFSYDTTPHHIICMAIIIIIVLPILTLSRSEEMRSYSNGKKTYECHSVCVHVSVQIVLLILFSIYNENLSNNYHAYIAIC